MQAIIIKALGVTAQFKTPQDIESEWVRRKNFIAEILVQSQSHVLVLGISGGVDSMTAGRLCQLAVQELRHQKKNHWYRFVAVRLPYRKQFDEKDAQDALEFIQPDECRVVNIEAAVQGLYAQLPDLNRLPPGEADKVLGNIKARTRMVAQYAIANEHQGLVVGTDHAAEAVMGFFTKHGDGACDLAPLSGLTKTQVRQIAQALGAPDALVYKTPTADLEDLAPGKPDEEAHHVCYEDIDAYLHGHSVPEQSRKRIEAAYKASQHKRIMPVTPAIGRD